jgi:SprT-like protein
MYTTLILRQKAQRFAKEYFGLDFNLPIVISSRMTKSLGFYKYNLLNDKIYPYNLQFSQNLLDGRYREETIDDVIKHEVCHWALSVLGKPFKDADDYFLNELKRIGSHPTHSIKAAGPLYVSVCSKCGKVVAKSSSHAKVAKYCQPTYSTKCCGTRIVMSTPEIREDNNKILTPDFSGASHVASQEKHEKVATQTQMSKPTYNHGDIHSIIQPGPKGVTNAQMIGAIKNAIDENSKIKLNLLKQHYPSVYESSLKYIGKSYQTRLQFM